MTLRTILAGVALASLLTGCGGSGGDNSGTTAHPGATGGSSGAADVAALWRQFAQCVRRHGAPDFPDPVQDRDGNWGIPPNTAKPPLTAMNACKSVGDRLPRKSHRLSQADVAKLRQFSRCMRQHGVPDWPDPMPDGSFSLPPALREGSKRGAPGRATGACRQYLVGGGIRTNG